MGRFEWKPIEKLFATISGIFKPDRDQVIHKLIRDLVYKSPAVAVIKARLDRFEQTYPVVAAVGDAFGGIGFGRNNPQVEARFRQLNDLKAKLSKAQKKEKDIRAKAAVELGRLRDRRTAPRLIAALTDGYAEVREHALRSLVTITGQNFGEDIEKWKAWREQNRPKPDDVTAQGRQPEGAGR